jgi:hypothetical protein
MHPNMGPRTLNTALFTRRGLPRPRYHVTGRHPTAAMHDMTCTTPSYATVNLRYLHRLPLLPYDLCFPTACASFSFSSHVR